ncbi:hypothetical protein LJR030_000749 [Rhizobium sp. LjRoot30]|uniref:hypothetical protein n=1 Tax=Rhizobium sp. LjRoot30 TaxID=3342320 RepID=UPI003ECE9211
MRAPNARAPINSDQLTLLRDVFDEACAEHGIKKDSQDAEALAVILVHSLQKGVRDKEQLVSLAHVLTADR